MPIFLYPKSTHTEIREDYFDVKDRADVFQSRAGIEINALKFLKLNLIKAYNHLDGDEIKGFSGDDFSGGFRKISFKMGGF